MRAVPCLGGAVTGGLLFVASPGVDLWPAAFVALIPLMVVVERASLQRSLLEGLAGGICLFAPGLSWLPEFFAFTSLVTPTFAWSAYAAIVLLSSAKLCAGCGIAWLLLRAGVNRVLAFACSFAAGELAVPGLVPYTISASLHAVSPLLQVAELGGSAWIVALLAAVNAGVAGTIAAGSWRARARGSAYAFVLLLGWLGLGVALAERARTLTLGASPLSRVLIVQPAIDAQAKQTRPSHTGGLYREATQRALREERADWVVWGETAIAAPLDEARLEHATTLRTGGGLGVPLLTGGVIRGTGGELYNSALSIDAAGRVCEDCRYDKQRLVPLAERIPAAMSSRRSAVPPQPTFIHGPSGAAPIRLGARVVAVAICYEALYADDFRTRVSEGRAELLVSLASDLWLSSERAKKLHLALIQLRSIEHRRFLVHGTTGAPSAIVDPLGGIDTARSAISRDFKFANVAWLHGETLWGRAGNLPFWTLFATLALGRALRSRLWVTFARAIVRRATN